MPPESNEPTPILRPGTATITIARLRLRLDPIYPVPRADHLRAAIASVRPEMDLLHQHGREGVIYRYPRVLYRVEGRHALIVAVEEGIEALTALTLVGESLRLGSTTPIVTDAILEVDDHQLGATEETRSYGFSTPWFALNQENHTRFTRSDPGEAQRFLDLQIANNCLSLAKSLGLRVDRTVVGRADVRQIPVRIKQIEMIGFLGNFEVNFEIPAGLGLGKMVSKGFGTVGKDIRSCR
jgi:hypothetical protein